MTEYMSPFGLEVLNFSPPECVNEGTNFYTRLLIATISPLAVILVICVGVYGYHRYNPKKIEDPKVLMGSFSIFFIEFVLTGIATVICKTFPCTNIKGAGRVMMFEPNLTCDSTPVRRLWLTYATAMVLVYPIGIPLFIFMLLFLQRDKIRVIMTVKKALEFEDMKALESAKTGRELRRTGEWYLETDRKSDEHTSAVFRELHEADRMGNQKKSSTPVKEIARRHSMKKYDAAQLSPSQADESPRPKPSMLRAWTSRELRTGDSRDYEISWLLLSMEHLFNKFEPDAYWYGVCLIFTRLLQTSLLVFLPGRETKTTLATAVAVGSLMLLRETRPWIRDTDDKVAHVASWTLFLWLFALQAHGALSELPDWAWGVPLALSACFLVACVAPPPSARRHRLFTS